MSKIAEYKVTVMQGNDESTKIILHYRAYNKKEAIMKAKRDIVSPQRIINIKKI